jgi:hypothetical protein
MLNVVPVETLLLYIIYVTNHPEKSKIDLHFIDRALAFGILPAHSMNDFLLVVKIVSN